MKATKMRQWQTALKNAERDETLKAWLRGRASLLEGNLNETQKRLIAAYEEAAKALD